MKITKSMKGIVLMSCPLQYDLCMKSKYRFLDFCAMVASLLLEVNCRYVSGSFSFSLDINAIAIIVSSIVGLKDSHHLIHFHL